MVEIKRENSIPSSELNRTSEWIIVKSKTWRFRTLRVSQYYDLAQGSTNRSILRPKIETSEELDYLRRDGEEVSPAVNADKLISMYDKTCYRLRSLTKK
jgi:hypothetical protein